MTYESMQILLYYHKIILVTVEVRQVDCQGFHPTSKPDCLLCIHFRVDYSSKLYQTSQMACQIGL